MLKFLKQLLNIYSYSFSIVDIDHENNFVTVEDKQFGIIQKIGWGQKKLIKCKVIAEYEVLFSYKDGSSKIVKILH